MADITVTPASVLSSGAPAKVTAGETLVAGQPVYRDTTSGSYYKADANDSTKWNATAITLNAAAVGQPIHVVSSDDSFTPGFAITPGEVVIVSAVAGALCPVADAATGMNVTIVMIGIAGSKAKLVFKGAGVAIP